MLKEFKEFISRGSVLDLAIGVIMGGTFSAIINSLVKDIFMPLVGAVIGLDFSKWVVVLNESEIRPGLFLNAIANFLIIAFILFIVVRVINKFSRKAEEVTEEVELDREEVALLKEIRDALVKK
ncbi:MAG: large conductance mechanosensitive channel protein MscL [Erysipelothrix sp.]|nr:large conductance mechanosensitive channel protein MscL [Erysipelothrix sp.]